MFKLLKKEGNARLGEFKTVHGTIKTPAFMNVATQGAIKGGLSGDDLIREHCQIGLCNTYHLHLRPGDKVVRELGGIRKMMNFPLPVLTDSGGFQVFSLSQTRTISEEGVTFASYLDGRKIFMGPEESMQVQSNLASTIAMAFDECVGMPAEYEYSKMSAARTVRWLKRCKEEMTRLNSLHDTLNPHQLLFGINQGCTFEDIRKSNMEEIVKLDLDGYAIGGLAVGEPAEEMYKTIEAVEPIMPVDKIRYLMGVGTPVNIIEGVYRGVDLFDCVMPSRNARHGYLFTWEGTRNLNNEKYKTDERPIEEGCGCLACQKYSRGYIRHLLKSGEMLGMRLLVSHNMYFYNTLMERIREELEKGTFSSFREKYVPILLRRL
ncbi:MAG: tRNA guanosine(34) transglycosylase Tgt [Oscillospiraceae bacterium]|nr:tRNA guanosine(34) transglycosylase Tgt [Oscillospiraceae bacterium]